ncbi:MAG: OmpA family protein [Bacteroidetes bacterium]|jgi:flagellar motor protein MotB|nr:OmpA family protein [Bacteroidota bacterium]
MKKFNLDIEENYWISFTDIISALFGVFILIFAVSLIMQKINEGRKEGLNKPVLLKGDTYFEKGKADIKPDVKMKLIKTIEDSIIVKPLYLEDSTSIIFVQGFTDNDPINSVRFPSNWELSTQRAVEVVKFIQKNFNNIPNKRLAAGGFSEYHPQKPNNSEDNKKKNRTIKITIVEHEFFFKDEK